MMIYFFLVLMVIVVAAIVLYPLWQQRSADRSLVAEGESALTAPQNSRASSDEEAQKNVARPYPTPGVVLGVGFVVATTGLLMYMSTQFPSPLTGAEMQMPMPMPMPMPSATGNPEQVALLPEANVQQSVKMPENSAMRGSDGQPDIGAMVAQLEKRIKDADAPLNDVMMLAQSYGVLGRADEAIALYDRAVEMAPDNFSVLMTSSEFMSRSDDKKIQDRAEAMADKILANNPEYPEAMWIKSLSLLKRHEVDEATLLLHQLRPLILDKPDATKAVNSLLDRLARLPSSSG